MSSRRDFIRQTSGVLAVSLGSGVTERPVARDAFQLGMAGYTFHKFSLDQTLEMMKRVDVRNLCIKDFHLPLNSTSDEISAFFQKLKQAGVTGYAVGPIGDDDTDIEGAFDYASRVGAQLIVGIPALKDIPEIEKKVKKYNVRYAIHNHGPDEKRYTDALSVYNLIKNTDPRMGICLDIGHDIRFGSDPVADLKKYADRIFDIHLKNVTAASAAGRAVELGRGVIHIPALVGALRQIRYSGMCSLEYEKDMEDPLVGIAESVGYFKGVCAK
ncbi:hypothetical protein DYBT9275_00960 [Dyadobacter sp. CECT 9275]|uniref:Xylose isomerase-like TIM barrel domain-containing protein n=1 Tax=Dyadobacter helix TaxID=2822344 RepID=A0A916J994_9BACT|nr:sugar phosphate isomerase/epimerase [Dyadobacter sp. CECT 9275]CAG4992428.1 hypothetical protein DYBT9275_00960 [Dyadobacter sp. CECT 9275]